MSVYEASRWRSVSVHLAVLDKAQSPVTGGGTYNAWVECCAQSCSVSCLLAGGCSFNPMHN